MESRKWDGSVELKGQLQDALEATDAMEAELRKPEVESVAPHKTSPQGIVRLSDGTEYLVMPSGAWRKRTAPYDGGLK